MSVVTSLLPTKWWRPLCSGDRWSIISIVLAPALVFIVPALFGHPAIVADNLIQNFPLRVLSGRQIASGHLPLMNPLANSGTPLLGGLNAGALYPLTVIFAVVPPIAAWLVNLIAVYVTAALGMFALLRWHGMRTLSSFAAAMSFTYTGAMIGQIVHLGVIQGFSFIPWTMLILVSLSRRLSLMDPGAHWRHYARAVMPWTCGYALLWGLTFLTGEPRGIAEIELLTLVAAPVVVLVRSSYSVVYWRARIAYVLTLGVGLAWGVAIGLVQLLPGWSFIGLSQRSVISYQYFGAGSLVVRWTPLLLVPDLFGGNGIVGHGYFVNYNLAEVTGYAGLLAVIALFAFLTRFTRRGWRSPERDYVVYFVIALVGLFATWGSFTPLGHVFKAIPLFGSTRLQSRNVILLDFALSALLGWWLNHLQARDTSAAGLDGRSRWLTAAPALAVMALCTAMMGWGPAVVRYLDASTKNLNLANGEKVTLLLHLVIALGAFLPIVFWRRSGHLLKVLLGVLALDIVLFLVLCSTSLVGGGGATMPSRSNALAVLGNDGRFAMVNEGGDTSQYEQLGVPNLNVFTGIPSVQGYGSLISTIYDNSTGTHPQSMVDPCHLALGTFTQLRLGAIAVSSTQLSSKTWVNLPASPTCLPPRVTPRTQRYFGQLLAVRTVTISGHRGQRVSSGPVSVQLLDANGHLFGPRLVEAGASTMRFTFARADDLAAGFEVRASNGVSVGDATVTQLGAKAPSYRLDTPFQLALSTSKWRLATTVGTFAVFRATHVLPPAWLQAPPEGSRVTNLRNVAWGDTWVTVHAVRPVVLARSVAYLPGWRATAVNTVTRTSVTLPVTRDGLIQLITVPRGDWVIHFHYHAPYIELGLSASTVGVVLLCAVAGYLVANERRKRAPGDRAQSPSQS